MKYQILTAALIGMLSLTSQATTLECTTQASKATDAIYQITLEHDLLEAFNTYDAKISVAKKDEGPLFVLYGIVKPQSTRLGTNYIYSFPLELNLGLTVSFDYIPPKNCYPHSRSPITDCQGWYVTVYQGSIQLDGIEHTFSCTKL